MNALHSSEKKKQTNKKFAGSKINWNKNSLYKIFKILTYPFLETQGQIVGARGRQNRQNRSERRGIPRKVVLFSRKFRKFCSENLFLSSFPRQGKQKLQDVRRLSCLVSGWFVCLFVFLIDCLFVFCSGGRRGETVDWNRFVCFL